MSNDHLTEDQIELLMVGDSSGDADARRHLQDCPACAGRLDELEGADREIQNLRQLTASATDRCPSEKVWYELAGNLLDSATSSKLLEHAARCPACAQLLKASVESIPGEPEDLSALDSGSPEWRKNLARRLTLELGQKKLGQKKKSRWNFFWMLAPAAIALCVIVAVVFKVSDARSPRAAERLLAEAYSGNRTIEMRLPSAAYARFHQVRSGNENSVLSKPKSFLAAQNMVAEHLASQPQDAQWLALESQLDLLDGRYAAALATLNNAESGPVRPGLASLHLTRAIALYEESKELEKPELASASVDELSIVLKTDPNDLPALFNRALACEKLAMYECAIHDWKHLLEVETDSGWAGEARQRLQAIEDKKTLGH